MRKLLGLLLLGIACGDRTGLDVSLDAVDATADVFRLPDASRRDSSVVLDASEPDAGKATCAAPPDAGSAPFPNACGHDLKVVSITPSSTTCFLDLKLAPGTNGALTVFCDGGYSAAFLGSGAMFEGNFQNGVVEVCRSTTFDYSDGCTWASAQRIQGNVASGTLTFEYAEAPIKGTHCASPCTASGVVAVK